MAVEPDLDGISIHVVLGFGGSTSVEKRRIGLLIGLITLLTMAVFLISRLESYTTVFPIGIATGAIAVAATAWAARSKTTRIQVTRSQIRIGEARFDRSRVKSFDTVGGLHQPTHVLIVLTNGRRHRWLLQSTSNDLRTFLRSVDALDPSPGTQAEIPKALEQTSTREI